MGNEFFEQLRPDVVHQGFAVKNVYLDARDSAAGARFVHRHTGFTLDLFQIQSVPQSLIWVQTPPDGDMGEPHTCEHLLSGKGAKGRYAAFLEDMSLGNSTAYTSQLYTAYPFSSPGGNEVFYDLLEAKLDALMHPDYSDEEIRREVCNVGVSADAADGTLRLEEKGTVYTEMISYYEGYWYHLNTALESMMYGPDHPLANVSAGNPDSLRQMTPDDLRTFHAKNYQADNMGMIATIPPDMPTEDFLNRFDRILGVLDSTASTAVTPPRYPDMPEPRPTDPPGSVRIVEYPGSNPQEPGQMMFAWPPNLDLDSREMMLLRTFVHCLAGDQTSNLYHKFINSATRVRNWGATSVWRDISSEAGHAVTIGLVNVDADYIADRDLSEIADLIREEAARIAAYRPNSKELNEFNDRARAYLRQREKDLRSYLNSPPGFGNRGGGGGRWYGHLKRVQMSEGFRKSLVQKEDMGYVLDLLDSEGNLWAPLIDKWGFAQTTPYAAGARANPDMMTKILEAKSARLIKFTKQLKNKYDVPDDAEAIARYKSEYDRNTQIIDDRASQIAMPSFLDNPPLTYDPQLNYRIDTLAGAVPVVASTFNTMTSATVGIALRMNIVPRDRLLYLPFLPKLITDIGVIKDGEVIDYCTLSRRLDNEILSLRAAISRNVNTGRVELVVKGSGSVLAETERALEWMRAGMFSPYLDVKNLPRIRDVVDNYISSLQNRMKRSEESWVRFPAEGYRFQTDHLMLAANCFLTQRHFMHRLKWRLTDAGGESDARECGVLFDLLASVGRTLSKSELVGFASTFEEDDPTRFESGPFSEVVGAYLMASDGCRGLFLEALSDLTEIVPDIPEENAADDWHYLVGQMRNDLLFRPEKALQELAETLTLLRHRDNARLFIVSNEADREALMPGVNDLVSRLDTGRAPQAVDHTGTGVVLERMRSRYPGLESPTYVGLVNSDTRNGVFLYSHPCARPEDDDESKLLDFLTVKLYGGGGAHSMFMKTWSAGLAYSNGLRSSELSGDLNYYAERCPDLSLTMRFVVDELAKAPADPLLAEYAVAQAFLYNRGANSYESRGEAMAGNIADGITDDVIAGFRRRILAFRENDDLYDRLKSRMEDVYGRLLIGYGKPLDSYPKGTYFIIGPDAQFESLEEYIASVETERTVYRIYPRDFWITY